LRDYINAIVPGVYEHLEDIASFDQEKATRIVSLILQSCCTAQSTGAIVAGRNAFKKLPASWISANLPSFIEQAIDLKDAWEYRRLLELFRETNIVSGLESSNPEIREAACDFADRR